MAEEDPDSPVTQRFRPPIGTIRGQEADQVLAAVDLFVDFAQQGSAEYAGVIHWGKCLTVEILTRFHQLLDRRPRQIRFRTAHQGQDRRDEAQAVVRLGDPQVLRDAGIGAAREEQDRVR